MLSVGLRNNLHRTQMGMPTLPLSSQHVSEALTAANKAPFSEHLPSCHVASLAKRLSAAAFLWLLGAFPGLALEAWGT